MWIGSLFFYLELFSQNKNLKDKPDDPAVASQQFAFC